MFVLGRSVQGGLPNSFIKGNYIVCTQLFSFPLKKTRGACNRITSSSRWSISARTDGPSGRSFQD